MLIPNVAIDQFLALMRVGTRRYLGFEVFEGVMQSPDVDTILAYHPKTLANQWGFMFAIAIQDRGEGTLGSSSHETTHAFWKNVQECPDAVGVVDPLSELFPHEVPVAFMVGLVVIITGHQPVLHQLFQVLSGHTGERFRYGIPGDRDTGKVTMQSNIVGGGEYQVAEELILPPGILLSIRFQRVIQASASNEVCGHTDIGFTFSWENLPSLGWRGVLVTVKNLTDVVCCPLLSHTTDPRWGD
jgi:hypothetical protein